MLPKIWKKLLLAICIIAILFNITSKLVNRISLERTISSAPEGIDVVELLNIVEEEKVVERNTVSNYNTVSTNTVENEETANLSNENTTREENNEEPATTTEESQETSNGGGMFDITDISDFTTLLY